MLERHRSLMVLAATVCVAALTARLGFWQLDRAEQKLAVQVHTVQRQALPKLTAADLALDEAAAMLQHHRAASLRGRWLAAHTVFLENRQMQGRPGFVVLTPLMLGPNDAVLVQRGWLLRDANDRTRVSAPTLAGDEVEIQGRIAAPPSRLMDFGQAGSGAIRQNLELAAFSTEIGLKLRPLSILQAQSTRSDDTLLRDWPSVSSGVAKHHGYAFQWFALSALSVGLYAWFQILRPRQRRSR